MRTLLIAILLGISLFGVKARSLIANNMLENSKIVEKRDEASELRQKLDIQIYNLGILRSQYCTAREAIKNTKGSHQEIDKDFEYFYNFLLKSEKEERNKNKTKKAIQQVIKEYAKKHKERAVLELKEQKELAAAMQKELSHYARFYKSLQHKSKQLQPDTDHPSLRLLKDRLEEAEKLLKDNTNAATQNSAFYERKFHRAKEI